MVTTFLKAKHWQLFLIVFGLPILYQIIFMLSIFSEISGGKMEATSITTFLMFMPIVMLTVLAVHYGWLWSIAVGLQNNLPSGIKLNIRKFKFFLIFPLIYISAILVFVMSMFLGTNFNSEEFGFGVISPASMVIFPIHLFSIFCIIYCLYFVAKTLKSVELEREAKFSDYLGDFFLLWFYPIGIWIIQPKVNKIVHT